MLGSLHCIMLDSVHQLFTCPCNLSVDRKNKGTKKEKIRLAYYCRAIAMCKVNLLRSSPSAYCAATWSNRTTAVVARAASARNAIAPKSDADMKKEQLKKARQQNDDDDSDDSDAEEVYTQK